MQIKGQIGEKLGGWLGRAAALPARLLFPPACPGCRRLVAEPFTLCGACWQKLRFIERPWCEVLGTPFSYEMGEGILSADAIASPPPFARARAAVSYTGVARQMVLNLKFGDRTELAPAMARWMMRAGAELLADADAVVPVPLHRGRFFRRRFNQSAELARTLGALAGRPFVPDAVARIRATRQQVGLGAREREENVRGAFRVPPHREIAVRRPAHPRGRRRLHHRHHRVGGGEGAEAGGRGRGRRPHLRPRAAGRVRAGGVGAGGLPARRGRDYMKAIYRAGPDET